MDRAVRNTPAHGCSDDPVVPVGCYSDRERGLMLFASEECDVAIALELGLVGRSLNSC